jgi:predicted O-methyltransferase YrrM
MGKVIDRVVGALIGAARRSPQYASLTRDVAERMVAARRASEAAAPAPVNGGNVTPPATTAPMRQDLFLFRHPSGHYYSPIPSYDDLERDQKRIFDTHKRDLPGIRIDEERMRDYLGRFAPYFAEFPYTEERNAQLRFHLDNETYSRGDAVVLYSLLRLLKPQRVIEIGSGLSTWLMIDINERFFRNRMNLVSVDPYPERMQDGLRGDDQKHIEILPHRVQDVDLRMFADLEPNDIVFIDSTHVSKCDSDVNWIFFEILPSLKPGVLIHFHDTFWPFEYPRQWLLEIGVAWNEVYQMRAFLQYNQAFEIEFFSDYVANFMRAEAEASIPVFLRGPGSSIWLRRAAAA